ncbi:MAG: hypothetical protein IPK03_02975 [Bacteroidetes bacterium]|nr:hypothetical protein [Bacteroidota bacterium]
MKFYLLLLAILVLNFSQGQNINPQYDSTLAKKLGADEYGMKMYTLVILKTGTNTTEPKASRDSLFAEHLKNIRRLVDQHKLIIAGPFGKNENNFRGIFILNVSNLEEAKQLVSTDAAVRANLLTPELYNWYGSAAISEYLPASEKISKQKMN